MKYERPVELGGGDTSQSFAVEMVGGNKRVLEFGCAAGLVSEAMARRSCRVVGVEIDPEFASRAKEFCEDVIVGDAETLDLESILEESSFDVILFGDVLEHMRDPLRMLRRSRRWLGPEGYVVSSIPNIAHGAVRLALLQGRFEYTPEGLLDETHMRFFTHKAIKQMFHEAGFFLVETRRIALGLFDTEIQLDRDDFSPELVGRVEADVDATTYQFVTKAVVDNGQSAILDLHEREEAQRVELSRAIEALEVTRTERDQLREALAAVDQERSAELDALRGELGSLEQALAESQATLATHEEHWARIEQRLPVRLYRSLRRVGRHS